MEEPTAMSTISPIETLGSTIKPPVIDINTTIKFTPTTEGMFCAYTGIMIMALIPIFVGSFRSIKHQSEQHTKCRETGEKAETMTTHDAMVFPLIASCALFGLYVFIKLSPDLVNLLVSVYFSSLGLFAIFRLIKPATARLMPRKYNLVQYNIVFGSKNLDDPGAGSKNSDNQADGKESPSGSDDSEVSQVPKDILLFAQFIPSDILAFIIATVFGIWYIITKHWVANNAFGLAFALGGVELLPINSFKVGCILLSGLFLYDVFWVFGTDVMVSVAKKFDAPIKILFPQDFLIRGFWGQHFAMLGLGDIVIPGIFIAFLLRFDHSLNRKKHTYFWSCFLAYILGLGMTIGVMSYFKHAQPALLYLVPACILIPLSVAITKRDLKSLLAYRDHPLELEDESSDDESNEVEKTGSSRTTEGVRTRARNKKDN